MSSYGGDPQGYGPPGDGGARQALSGPGTALLVVAVLGTLVGLYNVANGLFFPPDVSQLRADPNLDRKSKDMVVMITELSAKFAIVGGILQVIIGGVIGLGATKMKNAESFGLAMTASILAMIPCLSGCCIVGLPIGIWSLVVLNKPEVKSGFRG